MTEQIPAQWRDDLVLALRLRDVPGARIGDVLAEVEEYCTDSGLDAPTAFGPPHEYARSVSAGSAPEQPGWGSDLRLSGQAVVGFVGLMVVLASLGTAGPDLVVTVGWLLSLPLVLLAAVATLRTIGRTAETGGWRAYTATAVMLGVGLLVVVTLGLVLDSPVAIVPDAFAAAAGIALLVGGGVVGTVRARRRPTADLVTAPGSNPTEVRRRNQRADVLVAWMMPGFAVVGVAVLLTLDLLLDRLA